MKKIYRVQNSMGWYQFSGNKRACDHYHKYALRDEDKPFWSVVEYIDPMIEVRRKRKLKQGDPKKKKYSWQDTADIIGKKIKHFNIQSIDGKYLDHLQWDWPPSGVYGTYVANMMDGSFFTIWCNKGRLSVNQGFKPNADNVNYFFPWYKEISRKRI